MSALIHLGEADHKLLNAVAEIGRVVGVDEFVLSSDEVFAALSRASEQLAEAHAALAAVRLALRTRALAEALDYHHTMAITARNVALQARMRPGCGMHAQADQHERRAAALRVLIGAGAPSESEGESESESGKGGVPCRVV